MQILLTTSLLLNLVLIAKTIKQGIKIMAQCIRINDQEWSDEQDRLDNKK